MSTYVSRFIEVKNDEGKWEMLDFIYPFGRNYYSKPDMEINGEKYNRFTNICDNACSLREYLYSGWGGHNNCPFGERGFPSDMSEELRIFLDKEIENDEHDYRYNKSYVLLSELYALYKNEMKLIKKDFFNAIKNYEYSKIHDKLNRLLELSTIDKASLSDDDKEKLDKKTKKLYTRKKKKDNNEDISLDSYQDYEETLEYIEENYHDVMSIYNEYIFAWRIVDELFGYKDDSNIRIVYYFS